MDIMMDIKDIETDRYMTGHSLIAWFLHLHCLLFGVLGWVSVQHFEISADVRRAI